MPSRPGLLLLVLAIILLAQPAVAQSGRRGGGRAVAMGNALPAPGLTPAFVGGAACTPISSPYGATTRYDGSTSGGSGGGEDGTHGGMDLSLPDGTPLRAVARGRLVASGEGGRMEGIYLWVLHLPQESGLGFPFLAKYQHLQARPSLPLGSEVMPGQVIALSGETGTVGGHYGPLGYPHLHLTVRLLTPEGVERVAGDEFRLLRDTVLVDPLIIYLPGLMNPADAAALPEAAKRVPVAHVDAAGAARPSGALAVWPVACP